MSRTGKRIFSLTVKFITKLRKEKLAAINNAKDRIIYTTYRYKADQSGADFSSALIRAAKRGVKVEILTDGSSLVNSKDALHEINTVASQENISLKVYNPIKILKPWTYMGRLHDKYMIVDDDILFIGERNTEDRFNQSDYEGKNHDWDLLIYYLGRSEGDSMDMLEDYFYNMYNYKHTEDIRACNINSDEDTIRSLGKKFADNYRDMENTSPDLFTKQDYEDKTIAIENSYLLYNPINIFNKEPTCFYAMTQIMENADDSVYIHTPYFISNDLMYDKLEKINDKARTTLFLNSVLNGSNIFGNVEYHVKREDIVKTGVNLLELQNDYPYHGKVFSVDDDIIGIGSFNGDMRSVYIDTELMMVAYGHDINAEMRKHMEKYENRAVRVQADGSMINPKEEDLEEHSLGEKIKHDLLAILFYPIRFML